MLLGYFNSTHKEFKVIYPDRRFDDTTKDDFEGVPVILL